MIVIVIVQNLGIVFGVMAATVRSAWRMLDMVIVIVLVILIVMVIVIVI